MYLFRKELFKSESVGTERAGVKALGEVSFTLVDVGVEWLNRLEEPRHKRLLLRVGVVEEGDSQIAEQYIGRTEMVPAEEVQAAVGLESVVHET